MRIHERIARGAGALAVLDAARVAMADPQWGEAIERAVVEVELADLEIAAAVESVDAQVAAICAGVEG